MMSQRTQLLGVERQYDSADALEPTHIYLNLMITTPRSFTAHKDKDARFSETRVAPLISNPSKYHLSCVRFALDCSQIPLMIMPMQSGSAVNTIYGLRLYTADAPGTVYNATLQWAPEDTTATGEEARYLWTYDWFVGMVNSAIAAAKTPAGAQIVDVLDPADYPRLAYDAATQRFSIAAVRGVWDAALGAAWRLEFNNELSQVFPNFSYDRRPDGYMGLKMKANAWASNIQTVDGGECIVATQEVPNLQAFNPCTSLVLLTQGINVSREAVSLPDDETAFKGGAGNNSMSFLTDMLVPTNLGYEANRQKWVFYNANPYRLTDIHDTVPLTRIDVQVMWCDIYGKMRALKLPPGSSSTIKLLFRKKSLPVT